MYYYTIAQTQKLIEDYIKLGGQVCSLDDGGVGLGTVILYNQGNTNLLNIVIKEVYLNEWSSAQTIRRYRKLPQKYLDLINKEEEDD